MTTQEAVERQAAQQCMQQELIEALAAARIYVACAYECAFPDDEENHRVLTQVDAALARARGQQ